ncbi:class I SAM-dependent methyltransferase [Halomonas sp. 328]|uniref:class I SAM-dependent methyltransferase n=1 Tax=Halomonas sp. 328 TaxID=2776704 RepID=UPI0018A72E3C|nr:class I SAM-dependent methyltransferase [Halomonas sp. 328]MBF8222770.1 class I SAM-dependent methyltransferase [Halomonas sp. 328]
MFDATTWNRLRYGLYAPIYDALAERAFRRPRQEALAQLTWPPRARVLLVGAGTGLDLPWLPEDAEVHATDLSPAMVRRIARRAEALGRKVHCRVMDAADLDYPDRHFDVVVMHLILAVMPAPERGLAEAHRVLRDSGRLAVMDKFQADDRPAGLGRRALNLVTRAIATDITRQARPLLETAGFVIEADRPVLMGTLFRALRARKADPPSGENDD